MIVRNLLLEVLIHLIDLSSLAYTDYTTLGIFFLNVN